MLRSRLLRALASAPHSGGLAASPTGCPLRGLSAAAGAPPKSERPARAPSGAAAGPSAPRGAAAAAAEPAAAAAPAAAPDAAPEPPRSLHPLRMFYPGQSYKPEELDPGPAGGPYVHKPHNKTRVQAPRGRAANDALLAAADFRAGRLLSGFVSEAGRLLARRATKVDARVQRQLAKAVKTARSMALMPYDARPPEFARAGRR